MSTCNVCKKWLISVRNTYDNGDIIEKWGAPASQGKCQVLNVLTSDDFGCLKFELNGPLTISRHKAGAPWNHKVLGPCPDCKKPDCGYPNCENPRCPGSDKCFGEPAVAEGHNGRCHGFGQVYYYDDGFIGDMKTQRHPKEREQVPDSPMRCQRCTEPVDRLWNICPNCGQRLKGVGDSIVIDDKLSILGSSGV